MAVEVRCPMPGKVVSVLIKEGDQVKENNKVFVIEAMKMQIDVVAPADGTVKEVRAKEGVAMDTGAVMAVLE